MKLQSRHCWQFLSGCWTVINGPRFTHTFHDLLLFLFFIDKPKSPTTLRRLFSILYLFVFVDHFLYFLHGILRSRKKEAEESVGWEKGVLYQEGMLFKWLLFPWGRMGKMFSLLVVFLQFFLPFNIPPTAPNQFRFLSFFPSSVFFHFSSVWVAKAFLFCFAFR